MCRTFVLHIGKKPYLGQHKFRTLTDDYKFQIRL